MSNTWYGVILLIVGVYSYFSGELVTFIMLSLILISLNNINHTLKKRQSGREG